MKINMSANEISMNPGTANPPQLTELVRGSERSLFEQFAPIVRRQSVSLDLASVERIDAAGISALISLYCVARESGHCFSLSRVSARVAEMLALVGLDRILVSHNAKQTPHPDSRMARNAA